MSEPAEKVKIQRTRKRIYEMLHEEASESVDLQENAVVMAVPATEVEVPVTVSETVTAAVSVEPFEQESAEKEKEEPGCELLQQDALAAVELQEPVVERELSAMEIAAMEYAAESAAPDTVAAATPAGSHEQEPGEKEKEKHELFQSAMATVYKYSALSAATGLIPLPLVDMAGFMAMQLLMLRKLCALYNIPFDSQRSKSAIAILASGINSAYLAASSAKLVPFIGAFSIAAMPAVNGALSYAVGRVFIQHFASGGTFLDFDPNKVRGYFEEQYRAGKLSRSPKPE
jgi:uncharacterized protein (DUF697 family)